MGSAVCSQLVRSGVQVSVIDDCSRGNPRSWPSDVADEVEVIVADIRDLSGLRRHVRRCDPDIVFHLAAIHFIPFCDRHPRLAIDVNVVGTQSVLEALEEAGSLRTLVFSSTAAVYAPSLTPTSELAQLGPTDIYGHTKLWAEQLLLMSQEGSSFSLGIARLFNVYGPCETNPHLIPTMALQATRGRELSLGNLTTRRDYVFTSDAASAIVGLAESTDDRSPSIVNVGSGISRSGEEVLDAMAGLMGRDLAVAVDASRMRPSDRPFLCCDPSEAQRMLHWTPDTPFEEGLAEALRQPLAPGASVD